MNLSTTKDIVRFCTKVRALVIVISAISIIARADFSAYYTRLDYKDNISGKYADIVVQFNGDNKFVFCRESSYLPYWQTEKGKWYVDEIQTALRYSICIW